jgi:pseudaminic acid biosynthesis-associated methylase
MNQQEQFWHEEYAKEYMERNSSFNLDLGIKAWATMLRNLEPIDSLLECGCNIGRNINFLNHLLPGVRKSIIEISPEPFKMVTSNNNFEHAVNTSILDAKLPENHFDLVYTTGVLIHIAPENLLANMKKIYSMSKRYILFGEIFSRVPGTITYKGREDLLFKRDFGKYFMENFDCRVVDYGFLWGHIYDDAGFDDCNYWVFEKK